MLSRKIKIQLIVFFIVAVGAMATMGLGYVRVPAMFGVGQYRVKVQLPESGNLYANANVTYRGTEVGRVTAVRLTDTGVEADLSLRSDVRIPSDLDAQVHSQSAIGEQYVALLPRNGASAPLRDGDVIARSRTSVPPDISSLLDAANRGVRAIPNDNLKTVIDESYTAFGGMGPELSEMVTEPVHWPRTRRRISPRSPRSSMVQNRCWTASPTPRMRSRRGRRTWPPLPVN